MPTPKIRMAVALLVLAIVLGAGWYAWKEKSTSVPTAVKVTVTSATGTTTATVVGAGQNLAFLQESEGSVEVMDGSGSQAGAAEMPLNVGQTVKTGTDGSAEIVFSDNSVVRLAADSSLELSAAQGGNTQVQLTDGRLWARILKPLGDGSLFTVQTSDLSAGVRGTSVDIRKTSTGTQVDVIDSFAGSGKIANKSVLISYRQANAERTEEIGAQDSVQSGSGGAMTEGRIDKAAAFADPFVRDNTKRDLVYLDGLEKKLASKPSPSMAPLLEKVSGEMEVSLPKGKEIPAFFDSKAIADYADQVGGSGSLAPDDARAEMMASVRDDMQYVDQKDELDRKREETPKDPAAAQRHQEEIDRLQQQVQNFDTDWTTRKQAERANRQGPSGGPDTMSGQTMAPNPEGRNGRRDVRVPNPEKYEGPKSPVQTDVSVQQRSDVQLGLPVRPSRKPDTATGSVPERKPVFPGIRLPIDRPRPSLSGPAVPLNGTL